MIKSITTPGKKFGPTMHIVERIIVSSVAAPPYFWSKSECDPRKMNPKVYQRVGLLIQACRATSKKYSEEILLASFNNLKRKQIKKIYDLASWQGNLGKLISGFTFYCEQEKAKQARLARPKDSSEPTPIMFDPGEDLRNNKQRTIKINLWEEIGVLYGEEEGSD